MTNNETIFIILAIFVLSIIVDHIIAPWIKNRIAEEKAFRDQMKTDNAHIYKGVMEKKGGP